MSNVVIAGYVRSPFHLANKGALRKTRADDMAGAVIKGLVEKTKVNPDHIEDLIMGCAFPEAEQGFNIGRCVVFLAADDAGFITGSTISANGGQNLV